MEVFRDHKISINHLLGFISKPSCPIYNRLLKLIIPKVLHGKKMFYLLMYGILRNEKLS